MKSWHLWVGLALLVLLLLSVREGFVATATIKNPNTWDAAEYTRIRKLVNGSEYTSDLRTAVAALSDTEIREVVGGFWSYSLPGRLPSDTPIAKGWSNETTQITASDVNAYMDSIVRATPGYASKRAAFTALLTEYYIKQGESTFQEARDAKWRPSGSQTPSPPPAQESTEAPKEIERPTTSTQSLRQEIATTYGISVDETASIDAVILQVQSFYDTKYLPDKKDPTYTDIMGFADGVPTDSLPANIKNNFKVHLVEVLQTYFTKPSGVSGTRPSGTRTGGADITGLATGGAEEGTWAGTGKNVQGPSSGGRGIADVGTTTGGIGIPRNYPVLYGGMQEYKSAIPSSKSLGSDPTARFLPYSRIPGDQDLYPDPYRLGKYFSSSSYANKDAPEPAPFLADFSKFFT